MSMTTEPGRMPLSASSVTSSGGRRPGTSAVVITTSKSPIRSCSASCCASRSSSVSARAYPPTPSDTVTPRSRKRAPSDCTSSRVSGRMSYPVTTAPSRRAVPIAARPATPAPSTSTCAGLAVPAAVISSGKYPP